MLASAVSSPVNGETILGRRAPIPSPLSRTQLDCTRLSAPPAPAKAMAPSSVAAGTAAGGQQPPGVAPVYDSEVPVRGKAGPGLEPFDAAMTQIMDRHGVPGAALAIARNGKLLLAKGYGWADLQPGTPVSPDARFGARSERAASRIRAAPPARDR